MNVVLYYQWTYQINVSFTYTVNLNKHASNSITWLMFRGKVWWSTFDVGNCSKVTGSCKPSFLWLFSLLRNVHVSCLRLSRCIYNAIIQYAYVNIYPAFRIYINDIIYIQYSCSIQHMFAFITFVHEFTNR